MVWGGGNEISSIMADQSIDLSGEDLVSEVARLRDEIARLQSMVERLDELAHLDSLLELPNRRGFMRRLEALIARVKRYGDDAAMLFVDIDGLKGINDRHGHKAGTPSTGRAVIDAVIPGRWAAPPAPAMISRSPRPFAAAA